MDPLEVDAMFGGCGVAAVAEGTCCSSGLRRLESMNATPCLAGEG